MADEDGRVLIDEKGRIFGAVNVIDALVVLFVAALVIGGVWFVAVSDPGSNGAGEGANGDDADTGPDSQTAIRYATLDIGTVSPEVAAQIEIGDEIQTGPDANLTIVDLYRAPAGDNIRMFARVEMTGTVIETDAGERFEYNEAPPRIERELTLATDRYEASGEIRSVSAEGSELPRTTVDTVLDATVSATALDAMSVGDRYVLGEDTVATIETIEAYGTSDPDTKRAQVGVTYRTVEPAAGVRPSFGTTTIRSNSTLSFETETYEFEGTVERVGALDPRGELTTRTATLELDGVSERRADQFEAGMAERIAGETIAELTAVEVSEADEDDEFTVTMTAELQVRETDAGPRFKNEPLRVDETVTLEFEDSTVRPTVRDR